MLSKLISSSYLRCIEISLWLSLIALLGTGWGIGSAQDNVILGVIGGFIVWFTVAVIFFGAFLILGNMNKTLERIEELKNNS